MSIGVVKQTDLPSGYHVSTVALSIDHGWDGNPRWFETMVFKLPSYSELDCNHYETGEQALAGHEAMCERWKDVPPSDTNGV